MGGRWVNSTPGHPPFTDQAQTPNCQLTIMDFGGPLLVFEVIGLVERAGLDGKKYPSKVDNEFYLEAGVIRDGKFYPKGSDKAEDLVDVDVQMRSRATTSRTSSTPCGPASRSDLNADIAEGASIRRVLPPGQYLLPPRPAGRRHDQARCARQARGNRQILGDNHADRQRHAGPRFVQEHLPARADAEVRPEGGEVRGQSARPICC